MNPADPFLYDETTKSLKFTILSKNCVYIQSIRKM